MCMCVWDSALNRCCVFCSAGQETGLVCLPLHSFNRSSLLHSGRFVLFCKRDLTFLVNDGLKVIHCCLWSGQITNNHQGGKTSIPEHKVPRSQPGNNSPATCTKTFARIWCEFPAESDFHWISSAFMMLVHEWVGLNMKQPGTGSELHLQVKPDWIWCLLTCFHCAGGVFMSVLFQPCPWFLALPLCGGGSVWPSIHPNVKGAVLTKWRPSVIHTALITYSPTPAPWWDLHGPFMGHIGTGKYGGRAERRGECK